MFRRFRHKLLVGLHLGIVFSAALGVWLFPESNRGVAVAALGATVIAYVCGQVARHYLRGTLGRLRRVAETLGRGGVIDLPTVQPGDDMYKLNVAVGLLATRLGEALHEEQRLNEALRRRERAAFLGELAASVAHEINNPLDGVQSCLRILRRSADQPARADEMLDLIDSGLRRIELIVRRLLTFAREQSLKLQRDCVERVVRDAVESVRDRLADRGVRVSLACDAESTQAMIDSALLEGVFVNLLINAADSMPSGGEAAVTIRLEPATTNGRAPRDARLCVDVADRGAGIPADVQPHIFEPFFTTKTGGKGTGLGLALAQRIVDAHRGAIRVHPREGGGTVFTVVLNAASTSG